MYDETVGKQIALRLASVFVATATANIGVGAFVDVSAWKSSLMAGVASVVAVIHRLAVAYRDGELTAKEAKEAFDD